MRHRLFVYGTLRRGEVNHFRLDGAEWLGAHRTRPCFTLFLVGAYPGLTLGGSTPIVGEVYALDSACLRRIDRLEDYPRLYDRRLIPTSHGRAWIYLYRGRLDGRAVIQGGDWSAFAADPDSPRAAGIRHLRDPKTQARRQDRRTDPEIDTNPDFPTTDN
ncbi:gamma-glutamylcyclotransferase family protein [Thiocystis violacea]|uniref:gamma-glutamylcyclotransferase family protein n=1 Tax=Thiocystis violacea TaxID=13725 RepID=UPI0019082309|nr:gamma-glutamylcyclotransferase family protein [Thiocystis violacea]MBK1718884.1 gamma-glutamylcyclotransferase [Thiocystis violacea]